MTRRVLLTAPRSARAVSAALSASLALATCLPCADAAQRRVYFYHPDHLGSTNVVTDEQGQVVQRTEYRPFGAVAVQTGSVRLPHQFTAQRTDTSTGLDFYNARYYDPQLGRFVQPDPLQAPYAARQNRYAYAENNPATLTDPSGYLSFRQYFRSLFDIDAIFHRAEGTIVNRGVIRELQAQAMQLNAAAMSAIGVDPVYVSATVAATPHAMMGDYVTAAIVFGAVIAAHELRDTGEGRQLTRRIAKEFFDDLVGMSPRAAYAASAVTIEAGLSLAFEGLTAVALYGPPQNATPVASSDGPAKPSGVYPYGRFPGDGAANDPSFSIMKIGNGKAWLGRGPIQEGVLQYLPAKALHTGGAYAGNGAMQSFPGGWLVYGTYGVCHTASNVTLLRAGTSNTVANTAPDWSTIASTLVYGNYGGHLITSIGVGIDAHREASR